MIRDRVRWPKGDWVTGKRLEVAGDMSSSAPPIDLRARICAIGGWRVVDA